MEAKVFIGSKSLIVGTYAKYNNGSLSGAWLDLSDYSDKEEFYEACLKQLYTRTRKMRNTCFRTLA